MGKHWKRFMKVYSIWHTSIHIFICWHDVFMVICSAAKGPVCLETACTIMTHYLRKILIVWIYDNSEWTNKKMKKTSVLQRIIKTYTILVCYFFIFSRSILFPVTYIVIHVVFWNLSSIKNDVKVAMINDQYSTGIQHFLKRLQSRFFAM